MRIDLDSVKYLIYNDSQAWGRIYYLVIIDANNYMYVTMNFHLSDIFANKYVDAVELRQLVPFSIKECVRGNRNICDGVITRVLDKGSRVIYDGYELSECVDDASMMKSYLDTINKYHMLYHMDKWDENLTRDEVNVFFEQFSKKRRR